MDILKRFAQGFRRGAQLEPAPRRWDMAKMARNIAMSADFDPAEWLADNPKGEPPHWLIHKAVRDKWPHAIGGKINNRKHTMEIVFKTDEGNVTRVLRSRSNRGLLELLCANDMAEQTDWLTVTVER